MFLSRSLLALCAFGLLLDASSNGADVRILFSEDFENAPTGGIPSGFTKSGAVSVVEGEAHSGKKALRMEAAIRGPRTITKSGEAITALGGQHWGRLYFKVKLPAPVASAEKKTIHATLVGGMAKSPLFNDAIEVRVAGTQSNPSGALQYLYNVQPRGNPSRPEFAKGSGYQYQYSDQWTLLEWFVDYATQTYRFFVNGEENTKMGFSKGKGAFEGAEIPAVFESMTFGFNNYQPAGENPGDGFVTWIDDIALAKERIGK